MDRRRLISVSAVVLVLGVAAGAAITHGAQRLALAQQAVRPPTPVSDERRPLGRWERTVGPMHVTLTITPERLEGLIVVKDKEAKGKKLTFDFRADYSLTRDHVLYGVVTSAGFRGKTRADAEEALESEALFDRELVDQPFCLRYRLDDDTLMVKDIRFHVKSGKTEEALQGIGDEIVAVGVGRYSRKPGIKASVPAQ